MNQIIIILILVISSVLIPVHAQTKYETEMEKALNEFSSSKTADEMEKVAQHFDRIAKVDKENWLPLYYSIFVRTLNAFNMEKEAAIKKVNELEGQYSTLETLDGDQSEILTLRGLFRTVKVAKDPMTYGMSLSGAIIKDYDEALKINPNNPRAMYLMAQYNMGGAQFWGKDPKDYCGPVEKAKTLFPAENPANFLPNWGEQQVDEILNTTCKK
jgi:hypothetical protein